MRPVVLETCRNIDSNTMEEHASFKEAVREAYWTITEPFNLKQTYEIQYKVYWDMLKTIDACGRLTGFEFDKGFEYANLSFAEVGLRNLDQGFSHMALARAEDDRIGNKTGVAVTHLQYIFDDAYAWTDAIVAESPLSHSGNASALCDAKLEWTDKCRLARSISKFRIRIKDNRSSLNNDDLERNLLNICKVVDNYLKRKNPIPDIDLRRQTLTPWSTTLSGQTDLDGSTNGTDFAGMKNSTDLIPRPRGKLVGLLSHESRSHEASIFLALYTMRNFGVHILNDQSALFSEKTYDTAFSMFVEASIYAP